MMTQAIHSRGAGIGNRNGTVTVTEQLANRIKNVFGGNLTQLHKIIAIVMDARQKAEKGVDYTARMGALCPVCSKKLKIIRSEPWEQGIKVRVHKCENVDCLLSHLKLAIKSVQIDKE